MAVFTIDPVMGRAPARGGGEGFYQTTISQKSTCSDGRRSRPLRGFLLRFRCSKPQGYSATVLGENLSATELDDRAGCTAMRARIRVGSCSVGDVMNAQFAFGGRSLVAPLLAHSTRLS